ncbi:hypothetical protein [Streptomyces sp. KL116D]|uniref:hypothetical protein n=1 Tax=Streptomyces sp. KL116D TaxID=3045152 RepID=UPI0035571A5D
MQFLLITDEPVQVLAAEPRTLAALTETLLATLPPVQHRNQLGLFEGIDLIDDPNLPPGTIHLRPRRDVSALTAAELADLADWCTSHTDPKTEP